MANKGLSNILQKETLLAYLKGELPDDNRYELEQRLAREPAAREAIESLKSSGLSHDQLTEDITAIQQRWSARKARPQSYRWLGRVAAIALLLFAVWSVLGYYQNQQKSNLYVDYFRLGGTEEYLALRGESTNSAAGLSTAVAAYQALDYSKSYLQLQTLLETDPFDTQTLYYAGLSAMQLGEYYAAERLWGQLLSIQAEAGEHSAAHWFLALVYLRIEEEAKAKTELKWIVDNTRGAFVERAQRLLDDWQ